MVKDPEASFRRLFGEEFARAYEEQLKQLKAKDGSAGRASPENAPTARYLIAPAPAIVAAFDRGDAVPRRPVSGES